VTVPEPNSKAGVQGMGWSVDVIAKGKGPAMDKVVPAFQAQATSGGRNPAFPGLVVLLSTTTNTQGLVGKNQNLAKLFQIIALDNTNTEIARSSTSASPSAAASASASPSGSGAVLGASASPRASSATTTTTTADTTTVHAAWFVQFAAFGSDVDADLRVFVVDGEAPDTISDQQQLNIVSNEVTVHFHINGGARGGAATAAPSASASASAGASASPSASPSASASPSPSKTP
jgi:hypothetical protein